MIFVFQKLRPPSKLQTGKGGSSTTQPTHPTITIRTVFRLCNATDSKVNFKILSHSKNVVLLTRAPISEKMQIYCFHSVVDILILPDEHHFVARIIHTGSRIELDPPSVFRSTIIMHAPTPIDTMNTKIRDELMNLTPTRLPPGRKSRLSLP